MTNRDREELTLSFEKNTERGSVLETFYPWHKTVNNWSSEGLPENFRPYDDFHNKRECEPSGNYRKYLNCNMTDGMAMFESYFGFDIVKRVFFGLPFRGYISEVIEENDEYIIKKDEDGWVRKYYKNREVVAEIEPPIKNMNDWEKLIEKGDEIATQLFNMENIKATYGKYSKGHSDGDYSIRLTITGFFWTPRMLMGVEEHMIAFYDQPELIHAINTYAVDTYVKYLDMILDVLPADLICISEDLSGSDGPMVSKQHFDEFVGKYYKKLIPFLKGKGVKNVFVDTDGDFEALIPKFIELDIDGFLPMDVNGGMDIVKVREMYPNLKFIGGFNKLEIEKGKEAIDKEFQRILPVIRQGGYIPGADHQVPPSASMQDYKYYISKLRECMELSGVDIK